MARKESDCIEKKANRTQELQRGVRKIEIELKEKEKRGSRHRERGRITTQILSHRCPCSSLAPGATDAYDRLGSTDFILHLYMITGGTDLDVVISSSTRTTALTPGSAPHLFPKQPQTPQGFVLVLPP